MHTQTLTARLERRAAQSPLPARHATEQDQDGLADLLFEAYSESPDSEGETIEGCREELASYFTGTYGEPRFSSSYVALSPDGRLAAACLVLLENGGPTIAYLCTRPAYRRKGIARALMVMSINTLRLENFESCRVRVGSENEAAQQLLFQLGFRDIYAQAKDDE